MSNPEPTDIDYYYQLAQLDNDEPDIQIKKILIIAIANNDNKVDFKPLLQWLKKEDHYILTYFDDVYLWIWLADEETTKRMRGL